MWSECLAKIFGPFNQACPLAQTSTVGTPLAGMYRVLRILQAQYHTTYSNSKNLKPNRLFYSLKESSPGKIFLQQNLLYILKEMVSNSQLRVKRPEVINVSFLV